MLSVLHSEGTDQYGVSVETLDPLTNKNDEDIEGSRKDETSSGAEVVQLSGRRPLDVLQDSQGPPDIIQRALPLPSQSGRLSTMEPMKGRQKNDRGYEISTLPRQASNLERLEDSDEITGSSRNRQHGRQRWTPQFESTTTSRPGAPLVVGLAANSSLTWFPGGGVTLTSATSPSTMIPLQDAGGNPSSFGSTNDFEDRADFRGANGLEDGDFASMDNTGGRLRTRWHRGQDAAQALDTVTEPNLAQYAGDLSAGYAGGYGVCSATGNRRSDEHKQYSPTPMTTEETSLESIV